ncbi:PPOX class F420-dependent oxidoreductase [Micromonospora sp. PLK6-60]|uniref:PPOX class F420-dependent oxidoreductase n=1 Tax=Micromonospora sp. PLK6-60 TaxID=2873383 RepID=UPI001CA78C66|nr:PPOX class F420-dependent oxidoreductase [Micromonospora sp. PLK6-60]MBY8872313.1 PPOX class F420-dependent oxidoreductase [Micromonospora sp. PLK6-60]
MRNLVRALTALLGLITVAVGVWALTAPRSFSEFVGFPPHEHFVHDIGAFQFGIGATLLLALIWADPLLVALAGFLVGAVAHTVSHLMDDSLGQSVQVALFAVLATVALVARWRERRFLVGRLGPAPAPGWAALHGQKTVALTSRRRDGTPVATPVSIAVAGDVAYVRSFERAWKTVRIRNDPHVTVAPSTARGVPVGPAVPAVARRLTGPEYAAARRALAAKYPLLHGVLVPLFHRVGRRRTGRTVHFALTREPEPTPGAAEPAEGQGRPVRLTVTG